MLTITKEENMQNFTFQNRTKIIFGRHSEEHLGTELKKISGKVLLHYGSGSIKRMGLYDRVKAILDKENIVTGS